MANLFLSVNSLFPSAVGAAIQRVAEKIGVEPEVLVAEETNCPFPRDPSSGIDDGDSVLRAPDSSFELTSFFKICLEGDGDTGFIAEAYRYPGSSIGFGCTLYDTQSEISQPERI